MILYKLHCADNHSFEAWFRDSDAFGVQVKNGDVQCPYCGISHVSDGPMVRGAAKLTRRDARPQEASESQDSESQDSETRANEVAQEILTAVAELQGYVESHADIIGDDLLDLDEDGSDDIRLPNVRRRTD